MAEDAYLRLAEFDPTAEAALSPDPETCPTDLTDSIARLVERRAGAGQSIGQLVTFAYRLPRPRGQAAIRRAREVANHILASYADHRSEERRVGKEYRAQMTSTSYKK